MKNAASRAYEEQLDFDLAAIAYGLGDVMPDADWSPMPLFGRIAALASLYRLFYEQTLAEFGLTHAEQKVLGILRSDCADTPGELARVTHQTAAGMTRTLDRLEQQDLVLRKPHRADRRKSLIALSRRGRKVADDLLKRDVVKQHAVLEGLAEGERETLTKALDQLIGRLAASREQDSNR